MHRFGYKIELICTIFVDSAAKWVNEEQQGKDRADYGTYLFRTLAKEIELEYGSGFSLRVLEQCRQFYRVFPIANALRMQLNWSQYNMLIAILTIITVRYAFNSVCGLITLGIIPDAHIN